MNILNWIAKLWALIIIAFALWKIAMLSPWASTLNTVIPYTLIVINSVILYTLHYLGRRGAPKISILFAVVQIAAVVTIAYLLFYKEGLLVSLIPLSFSVLFVCTIMAIIRNTDSNPRSVSNNDKKIFKKVWHLPEENSWKSTNLLAMKDVGRLSIANGKITFAGADSDIEISNIQNIQYGKQGRDFVNNWVKVEYENGKTAFFADGRWLGWKGILGGTRKIQQSLQTCFSSKGAIRS